MTSIIKAITAINPDAKVSITSGDIKQIQWHDTTPIAEADILAKQKELQAEYDANKPKIIPKRNVTLNISIILISCFLY